MPATISLADTQILCSAFINWPDLTIGTNNEPFLTSANLTLQTMTAPPFAWPWNRNNANFSTTAGVQDYTISIPDFGYLETASVQMVARISSVIVTNGTAVFVAPNNFGSLLSDGPAPTVISGCTTSALNGVQTIQSATPGTFTCNIDTTDVAEFESGAKALAGPIMSLENKWDVITEATEQDRPEFICTFLEVPNGTLMVTLACFPQTLGSELLTNGDFGTGDATGWTNSGWTIQNTVVHAAAYAAESTGSIDHLYQEPANVDTPNAIYRARCWVKATAQTAGSFFLNGGVLPQWGEGFFVNQYTSWDWVELKWDLATQTNITPPHTTFGVGFNAVPTTYIAECSFKQIQYGFISTASSFVLSLNPTISIEFLFSTATTDGGIFVSANGQGSPLEPTSNFQYLSVMIDPGGAVNFYLYHASGIPSAGFVGTSTSGYNDGNLHHCVVTVSGGNVVIYIDGAEQGSGTVTTNAVNRTAYWNVATACGATPASFGSPEFPSGMSIASALPFTTVPGPEVLGTFCGTTMLASCMGEVAIYSSALNSTMVSNHYNALFGVGGSQSAYETAVLSDSPTNFWTMTEMTGTTATDSVGGNNGTYVGSFNLNQQISV